MSVTIINYRIDFDSSEFHELTNRSIKMTLASAKIPACLSFGDLSVPTSSQDPPF